VTVEDFGAFYNAIHKRLPFDWQEQLMKRVADRGWPAKIALPTSSGKTSAIDIAVFHLALQAGCTMAQRSAAMRTFFVIDRRVVVDEAAEHAAKIATALKNASDGIVAEAAKRLLIYGGELPLEVSTMRGGMYRDNSWADEPNQPLICVSTVDQTGSRLLFRGYQVGESSRPVHAGLIGNDSMIILDEAHLSTAFRDTLGAVLERYMIWAKVPPAKPLRLVQMSATIPDDNAFDPGPASFAKDAELARRLDASKPVELREPKKKFEDEMVAAAKELAAGDGVSVVGVIANTVGSARTIFTELARMKGAEAVLLIGRNRPHCAQELWGRYKERIAAKKDRPVSGLLYVVATQTVEVGANIDFDTLVTEAAPLDSLRQRFGRLNRLGKAGTAKAVIVLRKEDVVYGAATRRTWDLLKEHGPVDFGVTAMDSLVEGLAGGGTGPTLASLNATSVAGPLLFPAHLEFWVQTNPTPSPDPDVAPFLHGDKALEAADVQVVWREDLKRGDEDGWKDLVELVPPVATEALALPIAAVRRWLKGQHQEIADVEGVAILESKEEKRDQGLKALRWRGVGKSKNAYARDIRPGDTIVVPTSYDGADEYGWNPNFGETRDIGDEANNEQAKFGVRRPRLRVDLLPAEKQAALKSLFGRMKGGDEEDPDPDARDTITDMLPKEFGGKWQIDSSGKVITWPYRKREKSQFLTPSEETDEDDESSFIGQPVSLVVHTKGVAKRARAYAVGCGLEAEMVDDIALAAELHDLGKRDERFQSWLHGKPFGGGAEVLAKSRDHRTRADHARIRRSAGYPAGARHEAGSVKAAGVASLLDAAHDRELVLYLIGVHHGYGRPLFPVWAEESGGPAEITSGWELARIDSGWVDRFWNLNRKYGYWGLAYLEGILRRADCMQSRWEERRESN
jgi:CRISPR-associated endonuclease/helicase Cas3